MKKNKKTGRLIWNAVIITVFLAGICILLYPSVSDLWNSYLNEKTVTAYDSAVSKYPSSVLKKEFRKARAYNEQHVTNTIRDAFDNDNYIKTHPYSWLGKYDIYQSEVFIGRSKTVSFASYGIYETSGVIAA